MLSRILVLLLVISGFSCNQENEKAERKITQAENVLEQLPDSALSLLETIDFPEKSGEFCYANYLLLYTEAKDKAGKSIACDSLIRIPVEYFQKKHDNNKAALACFYYNRFHYQKNDYESAMQNLLLSKDYAEKSANNNLLGLIHYDLGNLYDNEFDNQQALLNYRKSHDYFIKSGNEKNANYTLRCIGNIYLKQDPQQTDSAFYYYNKVLDYAALHKDTSQIISTLKNIEVAYCETGDYANAKKYLFQCIETDKNKDYFATVCSLLANIYVSSNLPDSAIYYAKQILPDIIENNDLSMRYNYFGIIA